MRRQQAFRRTLLAAGAVLSAFALVPVAAASLPSTPATDLDEPLFADQWNLRQINVDDAHAITGGSPLVRIALVDSGIDSTHPEFAGRIDHQSSVSCASGMPEHDSTGTLWRDQIGHGTLVAGILSAGDNGFGIIGVAPHVQLVVVKVANAGQPITPTATACAFNYIALLNETPSLQIDVANASFAVDKGATGGADPFDFFCRNNKVDKQDIKLVKDAVRSARKSGTTVVASAGNNDLDMAHPPTGNECIRMPVELPGVIGVSSEGQLGRRASTPPVASNFGVGVIDLVAPGGDPLQGVLPANLILSTFPGNMYRRTAGASFAAAHVSGVAALVITRFGDLDTPQNGKLRPGRVRAILTETAAPKPCDPDPRCQGGEGYNGFFGHGEVDALAAVLHEPAP